VNDFIAQMEAEVRGVDPGAAAFVRAIHNKHGNSRASMNLLAAILAGDAAIVNVFTKHRDDFGCGEEMDELVREARARLSVAERQRVNRLREEFEALAKLVVPDVEVVFKYRCRTTKDIEGVIAWAQRDT